MEIINNEPKKISFTGNGNALFGIMIVNFLLGIITFGFYYPWARAKKFQYLYGETEFDGSRFTFHGTGKEMFIGFVKSIVMIFLVYGLYFYSVFTHNFALIGLAIIIMLVGVLTLIPLAIHGSLRYRLSRTSWRGIHFGYRGKKAELFGIFLKGIILSVVTLYIYLPWFTVSLRRYLISNIRFGNVRFDYKGNGGDYLLLNLKGLFLSIITFGVYAFWWMKDNYNYYIENIVIIQDERELEISSDISALDVFTLIFGNYLIILFTLGLGYPWALIRSMRFVYDNANIDANFNTSLIAQTEENYTDAMGDDLTDMFDINII
jgi:uncharacterized membrane protein YjgN (DUF898 family)